MTVAAADRERRVSQAAGALALAVASFGLLGWGLGLEGLTRWFPGGATLKVNTAIAVAALALPVLDHGRHVVLRVLGALLGGGLAAEALAEWISGMEGGLGQWWVADPVSMASGAPPGRMAAATAVGLLALAFALVLRPAASQAFAAGAFAVAWVAVLGYAHELGPLTDAWGYGSVSLPTAVSLASLAAGIAAFDPSQGLTRRVAADDAGGRMLRRLAPAVWLLPGAWALVARAVSPGVGFAAVLAATATALAFTILLFRAAEGARRAEAENRDLSRRLLDLEEVERRSIASELHDELGQSLSALGLLLDRTDAPGTTRAEAREIVRTLTAGVRGLALELRPAMLDDLGLVAALSWQCERWSEHGERPVTLAVHGDARRLPSGVETAAFRIAQEALTNAARHSGASRVGVEVVFGRDHLKLSVNDDGRGFDPGAERAPSLGLGGMAERARVLAGTLEIATGKSGTAIRVTLPLQPTVPRLGGSTDG